MARVRELDGGLPVVRVAYRKLDEPAPDWSPDDLTRGYAYRWPLAVKPEVGQRVILEISKGQAAVVVGLRTAYVGRLLSVHHVATDAELRRARARGARARRTGS